MFRPKALPPLPKEAVEGYNIWAQSYDRQPGNLMLDFDEAVFSVLLSRLVLRDKDVADIGCGTGRHWPKLLAQQPCCLHGFDVSAGMLHQLRLKFPEAVATGIGDDRFGMVPDGRFDVIVSTLTMAHIRDIRTAIGAWSRMLKPGGDLVITDFHPAALARGGSRTFADGGRTIALTNYVYPLSFVKETCLDAGLSTVFETEKAIDESVRHYYARRNALAVYRRFRGVPMIYGLHLKKSL